MNNQHKEYAEIENGRVREVKAPVQQRARKTRKKILESAKALFSDIGFEAATTHLIAKGAGISVGGLYAHFPNKEEIFLQLIADRAEFVYNVTCSCLDTAVEKNMGPEETIDHIFFSSYRTYINDVKLNLEAARFSRANPKAAQIHDYWETKEAKRVADWLISGRACLNVEDVDAAVTVVARSAHEIFQYLYKHHGQVDAKRILNHLTLMIKRFLIQ